MKLKVYIYIYIIIFHRFSSLSIYVCYWMLCIPTLFMYVLVYVCIPIFCLFIRHP